MISSAVRFILTRRCNACEPRFSSNGSERENSESGVTLVEVMLAMTVLAVGALSALSTLTSSSSLDADLKDRAVAVRAAMSKMESIVAYDYSDQIPNLVTYWMQPANQTFSVDGLAQPVDNNGIVFPHGSIAFNTADPERIRVTVTVNWRTRQGQARTLALPRTLTEVVD